MADSAMQDGASTAATATSDGDLALLLQSPLAFVDAQLANAASVAQAAGTPQSIAALASSNWAVEARVASLLRLGGTRESSLLSLVPSLNGLRNGGDVSHLRPNQLVRFRGMVQETFQPDYFMGLWTATPAQGAAAAPTPARLTGKYRDVLELSADGLALDARAGTSTTLERMSINVVPIPGESPWVAAAATKAEQKAGAVAPAALTTTAAASSSSASAAPSSAKKKRSAPSADEQTDDAMDGTTSEAASSDAASAAPDAKKGRGDVAMGGEGGSASTADASSGAKDYGLEVIVTLYDSLAASSSSGEGRAPKVTQCYEFIGVLALNPDLAAELEADEFEGSEAWGTRRRRAVRMHALAAVPIEDGFPFIADPKIDASLFAAQRTELQALPGARSSLLAFLTATVGGDALAGELLLLFLLQRVHSRGVGMSATNMVGKLAINLIAPALPPLAQPELADKLQEALSMILPRAQKIDLNIEALNDQTWQPKKNYDDDSLESNLLHLSSPTCVLLDETRLSAGTLNGCGIGNLQVMSKLLTTSQLEYDFQYQQLAFDVDWAVLLLSTGGRTLLQQEGTHGIDLSLKLAPTNLRALWKRENQAPKPTDQELDYWRAYLMLARQCSFQIAHEMSQPIEDYFVSLRQQRPTTSESTLHLLLNLARLNSLSHLESDLTTTERWKQVTDLHESVYARNNNDA